mgnify:CR=1 FL=1
MTKYLETKTNSIEEAIKSVVLGEAMSGEDVAKRMMKIKTMKSFANKVAKMKTVSRGDLEKILPDYISGGDITKVIKEKLDPVNKVAVKKKFDDRKDKDIDNDGDVDSTDKYLHKRRKAISKAVSKEEVEIDEGYESEVMKVLNKADIDGYFKMGKLYVNKRDGKDAKKALEDSDEITKLPKMVMEDNKMMKLTKRQRQALSSPAAKGKGKSSITLPGAEFLSKKKKPMKVGRQSQVVKYEENEMDIVDTVRGIVEKKLDPVNPKAVKKKFDDRKDKDIDNDGDVDSTDKYLHKRRKAISKAVTKEVYDIGKDYAEHTLEVTPGQDKKDVDKMLNTAYTKNQGMREALAKVWGVNEGKSPFQKEEEKPLSKTMTGQKPTTVKVNPKIEEK